jgi:hypothetical protein
VGLFWASTAGAAGVLFFAPWRKKTDFDIVGCMWMMENILFLFLLAIAVGAMAVSGGIWIESGGDPRCHHSRSERIV